MTRIEIAPTPTDVAWWSDKVRRRGEDCFNTSVARWASRLYDRLVADDRSTVAAPDLRTLSADLDVPYKYLTRSIAMLTRCGVVRAQLVGPVSLTIDRSALARRKNSARAVRGAIWAKHRRAIFELDGWTCGHCKVRGVEKELAVDHVVPLSLLGANEPGNWSTLCKACNGAKRDRYSPQELRWFRQMRVEGNVQVRFRDGFFWPLINRRVQLMRREEL